MVTPEMAQTHDLAHSHQHYTAGKRRWRRLGPNWRPCKALVGRDHRAAY
jgi:hypothetical protein